MVCQQLLPVKMNQVFGQGFKKENQVSNNKAGKSQ